ncbi:MAG: molybdopterin cofactor-binding domain-containing protein [Caldilineaceae bacterium]
MPPRRWACLWTRWSFTAATPISPPSTPAYASSTTYISGGAVMKAAEQVAQQIRPRCQTPAPGARTLNACGRKVGGVHAPDGRAVTLSTVALHSTHQAEQHQIGGDGQPHELCQLRPLLPPNTPKWKWTPKPAR